MIVLLTFVFTCSILPTYGAVAEFAQVIEYFAIYNTTESQLCEPPFEVDVDTLGVLRLEYTVLGHCSSIRLHILLDDTLIQTTDWLGWPGAPAPFDVLPLSVIVDLGPISGAYKVGLQAEGQESGCNRGKLTSWGGRLVVTTSKHSAIIDIKPGSFPNSIGVFNRGRLPVAILGSDVLDVMEVNPETIMLVTVGVASQGSSKAPKLACSYEDVDHDGYTDLLARFEVTELMSHGVFSLETTFLTLTATLYDETPIGGTDSVVMRFPPPWLT